MQRTVTLLLLLVSLPTAAQVVDIFRRDTPVDLSNPSFEATQLPDGNITEALYYDPENRYLILRRSGSYYQMCDVPEKLLRRWEREDYSSEYYTYNIQLKYECDGEVPAY